MDIESVFKKYNDLTGDVQAAASLVLAEAMVAGCPTARASQSDKPMTVAQASDRYNIPKRTLYDACNARKLKHGRAGKAIRIKPSDLEQYLEGSEAAETALDWRLPSYSRR